ncbi:MAG: D-alanyl-D-alanine carboxypeptidase, partial [Solirubrobacteraceae bacterium]
ELVAQLVARGIRRVTGRLYGDEELFDRHRGGLLTKLLPDVPDYGGQLSALTYDHGATAPHYDPATFAAREVALTMKGSGIQVTASRHDGRTPARARLLATVSSPPIAAMTRLMDVPSDDLFADLFAKQLGVLFGGGGSIAAGARVISETIASDVGLHPRILDGSGLSRNDGSSPLEVVDLLRRVWGTPVGRELYASLPIVGRQGTVQGIALKTPAAGHCVAKTGTLDDVTNLAGYCSARGRPRLVFAFFVDGPENSVALGLEGRMIAAVARY